MENNKTLKQGELLLFLANRSKLQKDVIAEKLKIHPSYLSKIFKDEILSQNIKNSASALFGVPVEFFESKKDKHDPDMVLESQATYFNMPSRNEQRNSVIKIMKEKHESHCKEMQYFFGLLESMAE